MKNSHIVRSKFSALLTGILLLIIGCHTASDDFQSEIDTIASRLVPDNGECICEVSAEADKRGIVILHGETNIPDIGKEIINTLSKPGIKLIDSMLYLPDTIRNDLYHGLVTLSVANLRRYPDHRSELVTQAILGTPVLILKNEDSWLLIQTPDRYLGWTEKSSVRMMSRTEIQTWKEADRIIWMDNTGRVYTSPEETGIVGDLVAGSILECDGDSFGHVKIIYPDRREGFVRKNQTMDFNLWKTQASCTEENVCHLAETLMGIPYLWGGASCRAADCSGFVQTVFFLNGTVLPRDASLQAEHGVVVDLSGGFSLLERGDLLFFGSKENSKYKVTHVAIYKGDTEYIHSSGRVMINSLDYSRSNYSSSRRNSLLFARRIIGVENDNRIMPVYKHEWY